jgi:hypothetical protein
MTWSAMETPQTCYQILYIFFLSRNGGQNSEKKSKGKKKKKKKRHSHTYNLARWAKLHEGLISM